MLRSSSGVPSRTPAAVISATVTFFRCWWVRFSPSASSRLCQGGCDQGLPFSAETPSLRSSIPSGAASRARALKGENWNTLDPYDSKDVRSTVPRGTEHVNSRRKRRFTCNTAGSRHETPHIPEVRPVNFLVGHVVAKWQRGCWFTGNGAVTGFMLARHASGSTKVV